MTDNNQPNLRCECDELAEDFGVGSLYDPLTERPYVAHTPGACECTNDLQQRIRNGKVLWLCSNCRVTGDEEVPEYMQNFIKRHEFLHAEASKRRSIDNQIIYVLFYDNGYEDTQVYGVFSSKHNAERYVSDYVADHDGRGEDDFRVIDYTLDRLYND